MAYVTMMRMSGPRIAVVALALCSCAAHAQLLAKATLTVVVSDQAGARIPGAQILVTDEMTGARFEARDDAAGEATVSLDQGTYALNVRAQGFAVWREKEVEMKGETHRDVILPIGTAGSGPVTVQMVDMPLGHQPLMAEVPSISMELLTLPPRRLRHRARWF
jgi:hypothetical protein